MNLILEKQQELTRHPVYETFHSLEALRHFMSHHVFAVWDFMSLLKSLQRHLTCVELPWRPSAYPAEMVRLINQIVLGEESDVDLEGRPTSHFDLYLRAMEEIGADTQGIRNFLQTMDLDYLPVSVKVFVQHNLDVAMNGDVVEVASSFFFGREKLIPDMFQVIVETLRKEGVHAPTLLYYLDRHIEVDSGEHGPLALKCLDHLTGGDSEKAEKAHLAGLKALDLRKILWDGVLETLPKMTTLSDPEFIDLIQSDKL